MFEIFFLSNFGFSIENAISFRWTSQLTTMKLEAFASCISHHLCTWKVPGIHDCHIANYRFRIQKILNWNHNLEILIIILWVHSPMGRQCILQMQTNWADKCFIFWMNFLVFLCAYFTIRFLEFCWIWTREIYLLNGRVNRTKSITKIRMIETLGIRAKKKDQRCTLSN